MYQESKNKKFITKTDDGFVFPKDENNRFYQEFLRWTEESADNKLKPHDEDEKAESQGESKPDFNWRKFVKLLSKDSVFSVLKGANGHTLTGVLLSVMNEDEDQLILMLSQLRDSIKTIDGKVSMTGVLNESLKTCNSTQKIPDIA